MSIIEEWYHTNYSFNSFGVAYQTPADNLIPIGFVL